MQIPIFINLTRGAVSPSLLAIIPLSSMLKTTFISWTDF